MKREFKDKEMPLFYGTVAGIPILVCLLAISQSEWVLSLVLLVIALIFLTCSWPLKAVVNKQGEVTFVGPVRKIRVTSDNLVSAKAVGANDYRAHVVL